MGWFIVFILILIIIVLSLVIRDDSSEASLVDLLVSVSKRSDNDKVLSNVYVPKASGGTSEIDALYITRKGIIVVEHKNYAGWIFGSENNQNWTVSLYSGKTWLGIKTTEKHHFFNPVKQNNAHIKNLKDYLKTNTTFFSIVCFSDRGTLKEVSVSADTAIVCNQSNIKRVISDIWNSNPDVLTDEGIERIYTRLEPLTHVDKEVKQKHIEDIHERFTSTLVCPVCGGKLVLRTAKNGRNAGKQFYGCSNYPRCKYIKK